ncbi:sensor histidine kinase [Aggregatilinea lenta]|uniref:sensor histidine kinase n=1 Tax=Aggregatilinea lenta TaxID=913108 RepID=UPI0013C3189F|nr:histidine kinase [Aggregatilinea lenta]
MASRDEVLAEFRSEHDRLRRRIRENQQLIEQSQLEVDRLREKNVAVSSQLRRIEGNFDTIPRADIKSAYDDALDAKTRLLTMQGQLEKLRGTQEELQLFEETFTRVVALMEGVLPDHMSSPTGYMPSGSSAAAEAGLSNQVVIRIVEAQETERQRLARQMHDGPAQSLTNFILQAEICQRLFDRNPDRARDELDQLKVVASGTFQKVRDFIFDLRPMMLDDLGLVPTIRRYVEAYQEKTEINTQLNVLGDERRLPGHIEVMMFRSIQEIMGHARDSLSAKNVNIVLDMGPEWAKSTIDTDGRGFDPVQALSETHDENMFGLRTLKERVELVGGRLDVTSAEEGLNRFVILLPAT